MLNAKGKELLRGNKLRICLSQGKRGRCAANPPVTAHTENKHSVFSPHSIHHSPLTNFPLDIFSRLGTVYSFMSTNSIDIFH